MFNYNFVFEHEWEEKGYDEESAKFRNVLGVSYEVSKNFRAGIEVEHKQGYSGGLFDYDEGHGDDIVNIGPVFHYATEKWWATLTPNYQVTQEEGEAEFITRLIVGFSF